MLSPLRSRRWIAYGAATLSVLVVWAAIWLVNPVIGEQASFSFFYLAVSVAAWLGGIWPAVCTAIVCGIVGHFLHFYGALNISGLQEVSSLTIFVMVSVFIGILAEGSLRALDRARKAERAKDDFIATVAHELRSPLSVIHYANELDRLTSDEQSRDHIDLIDEQVVHLNVMIQDLLDVSRVARGKIRLDRQQVDASAVVDGAVIKAKPTIASREHALTMDIADEPMPLYVDPVRIEQVLANLLINAAKYTPNGGRISIRVAPVGDSVEFVVRDNGIGISEEMLPRVFELFVQGDGDSTTSEGGLGIGLALVQKIVDMHGGSVQAVSAGPGRGSEFTVTLPLEKTAPTPPVLVEA